jgi:hypothetical protein
MKKQKSYRDAVELLSSQIECSPVELVETYDSVKELASRFGKTPKEVSLDINKIYLESWQPFTQDEHHLNLVDDFD